ncbi:type II toxin-antitoxin system Phd/YefM family antitoxin [Candidatus Gottesmanbacteria bacterium]|nr:type II toxin-antitoxin system Phd/YefM family antitoxin [Candidatus Gottesmanbacteria bacterium]MBI5465579.1 type II toxin-antitoxin system Phd/YefM family antitoxin [Candidatus Gottesmanbacteria bacterium]
MGTLSTTIPANEARSNFYQILEEVGEKWRQLTITLRGKARAVIMSAEEFASWQETLDIMSDKKLTQSIKRGLRSKKTYSQKEVDKIIGW